MRILKKLLIDFNNYPGVIVRITLVLERQGYSIEELKISASSISSKMHLSVIGDPSRFERVVKQLVKLVDVIDVADITRATIRERSVAPESLQEYSPFKKFE